MKKCFKLKFLSISLIILSVFFILSGISLSFFKNYDNKTLLNFKPTDTKSVSHIDQNQRKDSLNISKIDELILNDNSYNIISLNNNYRNEIQDKYSVNIYFGAETEGYSVGGMYVNPIKNFNSVSKYLKELDNCLSKYPDGFFLEMKDNNFPLNIYLINNYSHYNVTGVTESYKNYTNISISVNHSFSDSFHHEVFHYTENYLNYKKNIKYKKWYKYNLKDFVYGSIDSSKSYDRMFLSNSSFVNDYAQTDPCEDRASTFEYMMSETKASCLNENMPIWKKAKYMSEYLDKYYNSVKPNIIDYWERFL